MAGHVQGNASTLSPDILFDITVDDTKNLLTEPELIQFVNYGQLIKPVKVHGTDGTMHTIELALLWDEDHIDTLRKTQHYASDPLLRVRVIRRLKLFLSIQKIDSIDFSDKKNPMTSRKLWTVLTRLSDKQMDILNALYEQIEMERDMTVMTAMGQLSETLTTADTTAEVPTTQKQNQQLSEHEALINQHLSRQAAAQDDVNRTLDQHTDPEVGEVFGEPDSEEQTPVTSSPRIPG